MGKIKRKVKIVTNCMNLWSGLFSGTVIMLLGLCNIAGAFEIPTGNEDVELRWDNTLRYTLSQRVKGQNKDFINSPGMDDGDRNFDVGIVSNRLDILTETDLIYKKDFGVRFSGALWYDQAYHDHLDNTSPKTSNHIENGVPTVGYTSYADRYSAGPSGELLDAFTFAKFTIADIPLNIKVGRHTVYWGESMLSNGGNHSISYGQSPVDIGKAFAQPGVEIKELFRPRNQVSVQVQPIPELVIAGQYYLQWEPNRLPDPGTYLSFSDFLGNGSETLIVGPFPRAVNLGDIEPHQAHDWGISARWSPSWLNGTTGVYYRNFSDVNGQPHFNVVDYQAPGAPTGVLARNVPSGYHFVYPSDIKLYGISLAKQIAGISIGSEVSYRTNMPLWSEAVNIRPGGSLPSAGETFGTRGDTWHALVNFLYSFPKCILFDSASGLAEFTWNRWQKVTQREDLFKGRAGYTGRDRVSKDYFGGAVNFSPTWFQVMAGVDLSMPMSVSMGLSGNSAVTSGGNEGTGSYGFGFSADIIQRYKAELKYSGFFGDYDKIPSGLSLNGSTVALKDRDMVTLTLKTTF